jgi:hypothetical protein
MLRSQVPRADLHALGCLLMDQIQMTRTLLDQGYDYDDLRRLERRGELFRVRRGAYARDDNPIKTVGEFDGKIKYGRLLKPGSGSRT